MRIAVFGGTFNPPHAGHVEAAKAAMSALEADKLIIIPAGEPPHKPKVEGDLGAKIRLKLAKLAFAELDKTEVSDIELKRSGASFTVDTLIELSTKYPKAELFLLMGTDMFMSFDTWKDYQAILKLVTIAAFPRQKGEDLELNFQCERLKEKYGARVITIDFTPFEISSTELREKLRKRDGDKLINESVYAEIIKNRYYGANPAFSWLRELAYAFMDEKRIPHVMGCESEAIRLAERWGADKELAAEAGILHDITRKLNIYEQLNLCEKYGIVVKDDEKESYKLLHAKTGAALSRDLFGISDDVYAAIYWHTTGRENMSLLEKIIYMADYIEPNRKFAGVDQLRRLSYENLDKALCLGLRICVDELNSKALSVHENTQKALDWYAEIC